MKAICAGVLAIVSGAAIAAAGPQETSPSSAATAPPPSRAPLVVIDPGHGGSNTGAASADLGILEKDVTLALSQRLRARLVARGIDVALTRDDDRTLTLRQRTAVANRAAADLFVSVHANASASRGQRGFETYVLTPTAVDVDARALRADAAVPRPGVDAATAMILDDVERGAAQEASAALAAAIQRELRAIRGASLDRGVRQDAQHVLLGAVMPAVLVEVGFLNHPLEGRELVDPLVEDRIADALARAVVTQLERQRGPIPPRTATASQTERDRVRFADHSAAHPVAQARAARSPSR